MSGMISSISQYEFSTSYNERKAPGASQVATAALSISKTSEDTPSYAGPTYTVASYGVSGLAADATINGVPVWKMADAKQTTSGSMEATQETSLDVSFETTSAAGSEKLELTFDESSSYASPLQSTGNQSADAALEALEDAGRDDSLPEPGQQSHLGLSYDATV